MLSSPCNSISCLRKIPVRSVRTTTERPKCANLALPALTTFLIHVERNHPPPSRTPTRPLPIEPVRTRELPVRQLRTLFWLPQSFLEPAQCEPNSNLSNPLQTETATNLANSLRARPNSRILRNAAAWAIRTFRSFLAGIFFNCASASRASP